MKPLTAIAAGLLLAPLPLKAQNLPAGELEEQDPIAAAIEAFNNRDLSPASEANNPQPGKPVLVTGKAPAGVGKVDISDIPIDPEAAEQLPPAKAPEPKGVAVKVQTVSKGSGKLKDETVHLLTPFPAKPLDEAPAGWLLQTSDEVPALPHKVELAPGKTITLTIRPHLLVPDADNSQILAVQEPGFEASLGYRQSDTVSAVLSNSIQRLEQDSRQIGNAIDQLQQLIVSLPKPEEAVNIPDGGTPVPAQP